MAHGAAWTYGSQLVIVVLQFGYASITTRSLNDDAFGAYAVALSVTGFVALLSTGGIGQSVGRMVELDAKRLRGLMTYATGLGVIAAAVVWLTAPLWTVLWDAPSALGPIQWFAVSAGFAPLVGFATGYVRRIGRFRQLAIFTLVANVLGMAIGVAAVLAWDNAEALLVFPLVAQLATLVGALILSDRRHLGFGSIASARGDVAFSWRVTVASLLSYGIGNIVKIGTSRVLGPDYIGQWNRADVLSAVPFQQVQAALIPVIYPEFRHDLSGSERTRAVWTDMLSLVAWVVVPTAGVAAVIIPTVLPVLFGSGWGIAVAISPFICVAAAIQVVSTLLASAVEALGKFRWIWWTQGLLLLIQLLAVLAISLSQSIAPAMIALVATMLAQHIVYVCLCVKDDYLDGRSLLTTYGIVTLASVFAYFMTQSLLWMGTSLFTLAPVATLLTLIPVAALVVVLWAFRWKLTPVKIARKYGLLRG
ncbi:Membrane protein involved in the export of O-antigen and teichoic acid [Microbacterium testaceum StLB037]|uniref:Membrane protein involved in the export of O-antigen and teichoic acid n=1 Tax=Microbacterium testaceum (strain StLB037) TaxID=979556 RepID=A0A1H0S435_MICTS|nr:oligosaccharide flippase family protein [Microbacterium testaceum]SDP36385.1 Membrane protein involved in the export of O-antigen and teichoic acid [Microbacterium testaceum StLB037]